MSSYMWCWCKPCMDRTGHQYVEQLGGWMCVHCHNVNTNIRPQMEEKVSTKAQAEQLVEEHAAGVTPNMDRADMYAFYSQYCADSEVIDDAIVLTERSIYGTET